MINIHHKPETVKHSTSLFHLNVRSIRNKISHLECLLHELKLPSIVCTSEHWLSDDEVTQYSLNNNYRLINSFCKSNLRGGVLQYMHCLI